MRGCQKTQYHGVASGIRLLPHIGVGPDVALWRTTMSQNFFHLEGEYNTIVV